VAVLCLWAGCSRGSDENLGMGGKPQPAAIDVGKLAQPAELLRVLALPGSEIDRRLGARHVEASSSVKLEPPGKPAETLDETFKLDSDGAGALHLTHDNSRQMGVEAVVHGGEIYVRPRYGKFIKRRPEGDEIDRLRATVESVVGDDLALLERFLKVSEVGRTQVAGRNAVRLKLGASATPSHPVAESDPARKWRETLKVSYIDGELQLDAAQGALLAANVSASYTFEKDKTVVPVTLTYKLDTTTAEAIHAPADVAPTIKRPRPMLDKKELLEGLPQ
jgi:hypothetical protein